jgi:hypothetical protein
VVRPISERIIFHVIDLDVSGVDFGSHHERGRVYNPLSRTTTNKLRLLLMSARGSFMVMHYIFCEIEGFSSRSLSIVRREPPNMAINAIAHVRKAVYPNRADFYQLRRINAGQPAR